jgi:hypothetical protein
MKFLIKLTDRKKPKLRLFVRILGKQAKYRHFGTNFFLQEYAG